MKDQNCKMLSDKEVAEGLLSAEKLLAATYNTALLEAATPEVRETLCALLVDTHHGQQALFEEMNSRGWYPVKKAEEQGINAVKQTFTCKVAK